MQPFSDFIYSLKYQLKNKEGVKIDYDMEETKLRVATVLAKQEKDFDLWIKPFIESLRFCVPAGRIVANAGSEVHKTSVSLINCLVSDNIKDSMESIFEKLQESAVSMKRGSGIGYCFSSLRPKGSFVHGAGAETSGPLSFMNVYDNMCATVMSAGGRRGAQMGTFDISHPDILDFISAKREDGKLRNFNLSVLITDKFMDAVKSGSDWELVWEGVVHKVIPARELWDAIMKSNYNFAEPGFLLIDKINSKNNLWFDEEITASNPCWTGDTLVATVNGPRRFDELAKEGLDVEVYCMDIETKSTIIRSMRNPRLTRGLAKIMRLTLVINSDKSEKFERFHLTEDHNLYVYDENKNIVKKIAKNLKVGDRLISLSSFKLDSKSEFESPEITFTVSNVGISNTYADVYNGTVDDVHNYFVCEKGYTDKSELLSGFLSANCGEQPLPSYGACLLGSVMLHTLVVNPFMEDAYFDYKKFKEVISIFTRMLDNVVEIAGLPLKQQQAELENKRRHGMGYLGLGSALTMLGIKYGSPEAVAFTTAVTKELAMTSFETGVILAREKGMAPILNKDFSPSHINNFAIKNKNKNWTTQSKKKTKGKDLLVLSHYFDNWTCSRGKSILSDIKKYGCRFTHSTSIAPTGTISASFGDGASAGIEPSFAHEYIRNVLVAGNKSKQAVETYSYEYCEYKKLYPSATTKNLPDYFITTDDLSPKEHVDMQAAAQLWVDSAISKTVNVNTDISFDDFKNVYMYAYECGLKGATTFRFNPEVHTGVLVKKEDLQKVKYRFNLLDGTYVETSGDSKLEYEGQTHLASNLADALKNKTYNK